MPSYELFMALAPRATRAEIFNTFRKIGREITNRGGIIRDIEHYGVRHFAQKARRHGHVCTEGRWIALKAECSGEARNVVSMICKDELPVIRWDMYKLRPFKVQRIKENTVNKILRFNQPVISDPVFDFPKKEEMRRLKYNAKRRALDENSKENEY